MSTTQVAGEFARCRARLEQAVADSCEQDRDWPSAIAAAVHAALEFAAADPDAASTLTYRASARWRRREPEFAGMIHRFAWLLSRAAPPSNPRLPDAPALIARIAMQVNLQIEAGRAEQLLDIAPDMAFLALMPYVGYAQARRCSQPLATA
jgi:hypothetical protein